MRRRRRWTIAIALFGVGLLLACWLVFPGGRMEVRLIMLGYTNVPFSTLGYTNLPPSMQGSVKGYFHEAVLRATNTGSVPVKLWAAMSRQDINDPSFARPSFPPAVINPGESIAVTVLHRFDSPWRTSVYFQRHLFRDRLYGQAWDKGNRTVQEVMARCLPFPKDGTAHTGWISNTFRDAQFPGSTRTFITPVRGTLSQSPGFPETDYTNAPARHFHITAPPPPLPTDVLEKLRSREQPNP